MYKQVSLEYKITIIVTALIQWYKIVKKTLFKENQIDNFDIIITKQWLWPAESFKNEQDHFLKQIKLF